MTREEAKEFIAQSVKSDVDMALIADAIKALEQEPKYYPPCEDCHKRMDEIRRIYDKLQDSNDKIIECPWCGTVIQHKVNNKGGAI